jgi:hypothetical protein
VELSNEFSKVLDHSSRVEIQQERKLTKARSPSKAEEKENENQFRDEFK